ncbi:SCO family protein [Spirobacillus cienkowskii]|uniref:SCO family protein n=1 Tax=Spirobacillus cienkowskii TaxID=495820 RepID=UPI0030CB0164
MLSLITFFKSKKIQGYKILTLLICISNVTSGYSLEETDNSHITNKEVYEKLNYKINLNLKFTDGDGKTETLQEIFSRQKVTILTLNYYKCTTMCVFQYANLAQTLKQINWPIGKDFQVVSISFDPNDTFESAKKLQNTWIPKTGQNNAKWNFYVGEPSQIKALAENLNFYFEKDRETDEFAHTTALFFIKPDGTFYRYIYGMVYNEKDMKHALIETSNNKLGSFFDKITTKFSTYNPKIGRYSSSQNN